MKKMIAVLVAGFVGAAGCGPALANGAAEAAFTKAGCAACHNKEKKVVGPSFKDVSARYKGKGDAVPTLMAKVRAGGKGVYGPVPMPPHPADKISDADLKAVVEWMLQH